MSQTASALSDASCDVRQHGGWSLPAEEVNAAARDIDYDDLDKFKYYTIGPACAFVCRFLLYPFSLVKTRLQMQKGYDPNLTRVPGRPKSATRAATGAGAAADCVRYTGTFDAFGKILRHEGPRGLFKGFPVSCIGIVSGQLYITTYEIIRQEAKRVNDAHRVFSPHTMDVIRNGVAGGTASLLSQTVVVPVDIVSQKQMMMSKVQQPPSMIQLSREILAREGVMGFYRGFFASVMVYAPSSAIWWSSYGFMRRKLTQLSVLTNTTPSKHNIQSTSGAMAGIVATLATNPIDVARTRLQVEGASASGSASTLRGALRTLWKEEGPKSLLKGVQPRIMATVPSSIMIVTVYEFVKEWSVRK